MAERKLFGTDGIRGKANVYPMTGDIAFALGRAVTDYFQGKRTDRKPLIIVGKDTRLSCYMIEQAFSAGVCSQGGEVILTGPLPTPGIAFVTTSMRADAGVMISASHNSFADNGLKLFDAQGFKLPDEIELKLEEMVLNPHLMTTKQDGDLGKAKRLEEVFGRYIVHCKSALDHMFDMTGRKVVLDCAHGAGYKIAPIIFREMGALLYTTGVEPNGQNINEMCGSMHPEAAVKLVKKHNADVGFCLDGDADRLVVIDEKGGMVDGDCLIGCFAKLLLDQGKLKKGDTVVGTVMSNLGLEVYLKKLGLNFHRTQVGDRYIMEYMRETGAIFGGEPSGHIIFKDHGTTGDGTLAALKMVECLDHYKKSVSELTGDVALYPQLLKNAEVKSKPSLNGLSLVQEKLAAIEKELGSKGRVVLRYSGTENKIRVMVEAEDQKVVEKACNDLLKVVLKEIG
jgi:phosphoglucosamine mutase